MKNILLLSILFFSSLSYSQENNDSLINVVIDHFFDGLNNEDTAKINSAIWPEVFTLNSVIVGKSNNTRWEKESLEDFLKIIGTPHEEIWEERILSRTIHQDGNIAVAWLPYEFYFEGQYSHEGVNMIQFARMNGKWVMISIIDTRKRVEKTKE